MKIEFDPKKDAANHAKHGVSMAFAEFFDFSTALLTQDTRRDYREARMIALGYIGSRLYTLIFTRRGETVRVISLRKANKREERSYFNGKAQKTTRYQ